MKTVKDFAEQNGLDYKYLRAILLNESGAKGLRDGKIVKRYEFHVYRALKKTFDTGIRSKSFPGLSARWIKSHTPYELELLSTSWGIGQIMGYHYPLLNYTSIEEMLDAWQDEEMQIRDWCVFILKYMNGKLLNAIKNKDLNLISYYYNGAGYRANKYHEKLQKNLTA